MVIVLIGLSTIASAQGAESIKLRVGEVKTADKRKIKIKFIEVVEDSRCPSGVACIWAGNAKIKLSVSSGKSDAKIIELNSSLDPQSMVVFGYEISFDTLTPYPGENPQQPTARLATIRVKKTCR